MASKNSSDNKGGAAKPRVSAQQKKLRLQQVVMAVLGTILVVAMIAAAFIR
jgi:hypothetical protein